MIKFYHNHGLAYRFGAKLALITAWWIIALTEACAHPHIFMEAKLEVVINDQKSLTAIRHAWRFDPAFSAFATQGLDKDGDGKLSVQELAPLAKINVESLKEFGYFTFPIVNNRELDVEEPQEYWLDFSNGLLTLYFTLPIKNPEKPKDNNTVIELFDPTYYVAINFVDHKAVVLVSPPGCLASTKNRDEDPVVIDDALINQMGDETIKIAKDSAISVSIKCD